MTRKLTFDGDWCATVTNDPLRITPRFINASVDVVPYADVKERERFLADTFGSQDYLWEAPDIIRFDKASRELVGAEFHVPEESDTAKEIVRVPPCLRYARAGSAPMRSGTSGTRGARSCAAPPGTAC
ncbi:hypothetical protein [Streptomyces sp. NBC_00454]|uniref:hypothetical protein n=1 Tax=Streptomyces sp. NBC_00454 TaxID=2975747 RepID=UPI00324BD7E1